MNSSSTNKGGWEASEMRTYVNGTIYNALPKELRENIINTTVVSDDVGYYDRLTTTDKLYLLSTKEVWGKEGTSNVINNDTAEAETRQLDYYKTIGVTTSNYSGANKQYNGSNYSWWLRNVNVDNCVHFEYVGSGGYYDYLGAADDALGVALALRLG